MPLMGNAVKWCTPPTNRIFSPAEYRTVELDKMTTLSILAFSLRTSEHMVEQFKAGAHA